LINGTLNTLAPLQSRAGQIKKYTVSALKFVWSLGNILRIWIFSYMEKRIYFLPQLYSCINRAELLASQKQLTFLDSRKMCLITDIHTYNAPHQVQPVYQEKIYYQKSPLV